MDKHNGAANSSLFTIAHQGTMTTMEARSDGDGLSVTESKNRIGGKF
jgi:hypothetical protein